MAKGQYKVTGRERWCLTVEGPRAEENDNSYHVQPTADKFSLELRHGLGFLLKTKSGNSIWGIKVPGRVGMMKTMDEDHWENNLAG